MALKKDEVARELVESHFRVEPDLQQVIRIVADNEDEPNEPIKLLEVNAVANTMTYDKAKMTFPAAPMS